MVVACVFLSGMPMASTGYRAHASGDIPEYLNIVFEEPVTYNYFINGKALDDSSYGKPIMNRDMILMIPLRITAEELGYYVAWNKFTKTVFVYNDETMYISRIGINRYFERNSETRVFSSAPFIKDSRTYVPLEFFTTLMRVDVKIDSDGNLLMYSE